MDDVVTSPQGKHDSPASPKRGRWLKRFLVGVLLLVVICVGVFFWLVSRTRGNPPYSTALELILNDSQLAEHLGEPIRDLRWLPTSGYPKQFQMQVEGPKGVADVAVSAGQFEGKWELTAVDVFIREGGKRFSLDTGSGAGDAPTWSGGAATEDKKPDDLGLEPPAGIDLEAPGGPPGVKIELPPMPEMPPAPQP
ncbi:MAG: hypothetical protein GXX96_10585 [Planctomycetaceae bacterium]|nr:hypothetical protein [Planctomycetaceae bacterium]